MALATLASSPYGVALYDRDGRLLFLNDRAKGWRLTNDPAPVDPSEGPLDGWKPVWDANGPLTPENTPSVRALAGETVVDRRIKLTESDGTIRELEVTAHPLRTQDDRIEGAAVIAEDVTDKLRIRDDSERARRLMAGVLETIGDMLLVLDNQLTVLMASHAYYKATKTVPEQVVGKHLTQIQGGLWDIADLQTRLSELVPVHGRVDGYRLQLELPKRGLRTLVLSARKIYRLGNNTKTILLTIDDVTDRERAQEQALLNAKLESIGFLAGGLAHDVNNRLQPILGYSQLGRTRVDPNTKLAEWLERIEANAEGARAVVRNVLSYARLEPCHTELVDLSVVTKQALANARDNAPEWIEISQDLATDAPPVKVNPNDMMQVLDNLLTNAIQALSQGGHITVALSRQRIDGQPDATAPTVPGVYALLSIADNGPGIPEAERDKIFDPFYTTKPVGEGTGLGLAIAHSIVHQAGGYIELDSTPGTGCRFDIWLPDSGTTNDI
ncbi:two-component sensor histidine kinase [Rhodovibrio salinarum]|uniref:histidine kinase n=2 Tax=Rhodovibrio salinarum TaxID=1087 RepID=A0A934UZM7_9PROT|nr:ATP-binding protein [Rhodovibrio salinarum]MBK1696569.1 two-component sensor histidine kinase [Rhodovibrio salinarum]